MKKIFKDQSEASHAMAEKFISIADEAVNNRKRFTVALAGGSSVQMLYDMLRSDSYRDNIPWAKTHVFWGDERAVAFEDALSNARMAWEKLLNHVPVPENQIHRMKGEIEPGKAADEYEMVLKRHFEKEEPVFDLILLGMGADGHTASIFPGSEAVHEKERLVATGYNSEQGTHRISLTAPLINQSRHIFFAVFGEGKAETLKQVLEDEYTPDQLPVQLIRSEKSEITWFLDEEAAKLLDTSEK